MFYFIEYILEPIYTAINSIVKNFSITDYTFLSLSIALDATNALIKVNLPIYLSRILLEESASDSVIESFQTELYWIALLTSVQMLLPHIKKRVTIHLDNKLESRLQKKLIDAIYSLEYANLNNNKNNVLAAMRQIQNNAQYSSLAIKDKIIPAIVNITVILYQLPKNIFSSEILIPFGIYCVMRFALNQISSRYLNLNGLLQSRFNKQQDLLNSIYLQLANVDLVTLSNKSNHERNRLKTKCEVYITAKKNSDSRQTTNQIINEIPSLAFKFNLIFLLGATKSLHKLLLLVFTLADMTSISITNLQVGLDYMKRAKNCESAIKEISSKYSENNNLEDIFFDKSQISDYPEIEFHHVYFKYDNSTEDWVLQDLSFRIISGSTTAIIGESGSGKSTILRLITGFYKPTQGYITIDGIDIQNIPKNFLYSLLGVVQQVTKTFPELSIRENILYSSSFFHQATESDKDRLYNEACTGAQLIDVDENIPVTGLSGGETQRLGLARILAKQPKVFILDEYTSALDSFTEAKIIETFNQISISKTSVIIGHRLSTIKSADIIIVLSSKGTILEKGTHDELLEQDGYYTKVSKLQSFVPRA